MYYCFDCETEFEEPGEMKEYHSELAGMGGVTHETFAVCPHCNSEDFVEMKKCEVCGEYTVDIKGYIVEVCEDCRKSIEEKYLDWTYETAKYFDIDEPKLKTIMFEIMEDE